MNSHRKPPAERVKEKLEEMLGPDPRPHACWCGGITHNGGPHVIYCQLCGELQGSLDDETSPCAQCGGPCEFGSLGDAVQVLEGYHPKIESDGIGFAGMLWWKEEEVPLLKPLLREESQRILARLPRRDGT